MQQITAEEIKRKIEQGESFVLDLFATWCVPCKVMLRNLEEVNTSLIKESDGLPNYNIYKFDVDSDLNFSRELGVRSVPTIKIYKEGEETFSKPGVMTPAEILKLLV
jgi:thioredoxin 1